MSTLDLSQYGIQAETTLRNADPDRLYEEAIRLDPTAAIVDSGALRIGSGEKTGRSPADKRIVRHPESEDDIWWGPDQH
jgi:Phosphoenolpyruvate carboxykinase (ATP)